VAASGLVKRGALTYLVSKSAAARQGGQNRSSPGNRPPLTASLSIGDVAACDVTATGAGSGPRAATTQVVFGGN
jgi:hypothetical protein